MSTKLRSKLRGGTGERDHYLLRLFVIGNGPNSILALTNLHSFCHEHLKDRCTIEVVDVARDFQAAVRDNILITPALILVKPLPRVVVLGNLSDRQRIIFALRLSGVAP